MLFWTRPLHLHVHLGTSCPFWTCWQRSPQGLWSDEPAAPAEHPLSYMYLQKRGCSYFGKADTRLIKRRDICSEPASCWVHVDSFFCFCPPVVTLWIPRGKMELLWIMASHQHCLTNESNFRLLGNGCKVAPSWKCFSILLSCSPLTKMHFWGGTIDTCTSEVSPACGRPQAGRVKHQRRAKENPGAATVQSPFFFKNKSDLVLFFLESHLKLTYFVLRP